jgi:hypothetical protein
VTTSLSKEINANFMEVPRPFPATLASYIAGFVDGEGTITLAIQRGYHRRARIMVPQSGDDGLALLNSLRDETGIGRVRPQSGNERRVLLAYRWDISRQVECQFFLEQIRPYLRLKQRIADVVLTVLQEKQEIRSRHNTISNLSDCWNWRKPWTSEEINILEQNYDARPETLDELSRSLRRTRKAVHLKAFKLGLTSQRQCHHRAHSGDYHYSLIRGGHRQ